MVSRLRSWWLKVKKHPFLATAITVAFVAVVVFIFAVNTLGWDWTGFNGGEGPVTIHVPARDTVVPPARTLWDWLQLLIIPLVLAIGGLWFSQIQKDRELKAAELRVQTEREAAENRAQTEREIAQDNQQETTLQEYIDKMSGLLLDEELCKPTAKEEARKIARVRTLTVLPRLNGKRKGTVLQFLYEAQLINLDEQVIDLDGADLREANLLAANLSEANLSGVNLEEAYLVGVKLKGANLSTAVLNGANLVGADLSGADLHEATMYGVNLNATRLRGASLRGASLVKADFSKVMNKNYMSGTETWAIFNSIKHIDNLVAIESRAAVIEGRAISNKNNLTLTFADGADLSEADLSGAHLTAADLSGANLSSANLSGANLGALSRKQDDVDLSKERATLRGANLSNAILTGADLTDTILSEADLTQANLNGAKITQEQLDEAKSLQRATMPDGSIHH